VGNIPIDRIAGLQEACVISKIWSFFPKPMKAGLGPTCEQHFVQFPENPQTQVRGEDTVGRKSYLYAESGPFFNIALCNCSGIAFNVYNNSSYYILGTRRYQLL
jgi:hypothetical protein